jgi:hypothetical protein
MKTILCRAHVSIDAKYLDLANVLVPAFSFTTSYWRAGGGENLTQTIGEPRFGRACVGAIQTDPMYVVKVMYKIFVQN